MGIKIIVLSWVRAGVSRDTKVSRGYSFGYTIVSIFSGFFSRSTGFFSFVICRDR